MASKASFGWRAKTVKRGFFAPPEKRRGSDDDSPSKFHEPLRRACYADRLGLPGCIEERVRCIFTGIESLIRLPGAI